MDFPQENLFSPTFIYLIGHQAVKRVKNGFQHDMGKEYFDAERSDAKRNVLAWNDGD